MIRAMNTGISASLAACLAALVLALSGDAQTNDAAVIRGIDAAVQARFVGIVAYTVTEHYVVFRGADHTHPAAEMTVRTTYKKDSGKSYQILSQSGSSIILKFGLNPLLENEKRINDPANRESSWFTSKNYDMMLKSSQTQQVNGRDCLAVAIEPHRKAPNLLVGTIWVDAKDYSIMRIEGTATKKPSIWSGPAQMTRDYAKFNGYSEATHAQAISDSSIFGQTMVTIDYQDYQMQLSPSR
jgi:outer membrane lipoprotein-sorting protein